jgi:hypothetical protein
MCQPPCRPWRISKVAWGRRHSACHEPMRWCIEERRSASSMLVRQLPRWTGLPRPLMGRHPRYPLCIRGLLGQRDTGKWLIPSYLVVDGWMVVYLQPAGHSSRPKIGENTPFHGLCEGAIPWSATMFPTSWDCWDCSGDASCGMCCGQALDLCRGRNHASPSRHRVSAAKSPHPLQVSPASPMATPVTKPSSRTRLRLRRHAWSRHVAAGVRSTPHTIAVPIPTVPRAAGLARALSVLTVIHAVAPGDSCIAAAMRATFSKPLAPSFMARACRGTSSCP